MVFVLPGDSSGGSVLGARVVVKPASGNLVITALDFDLLLFRSVASIPFADAGYPADNAALALTEAMMQQLVCAISFVTGAWRNPAGALTAGAVGWQSVGVANREGFPFSSQGLPASGLRGVLQVKSAWTPGAIAQAITIDIDVDA
jgi:hypothetical protein